jgi:hypothetical protein
MVFWISLPCLEVVDIGIVLFLDLSRLSPIKPSGEGDLEPIVS